MFRGACKGSKLNHTVSQWTRLSNRKSWRMLQRNSVSSNLLFWQYKNTQHRLLEKSPSLKFQGCGHMTSHLPSLRAWFRLSFAKGEARNNNHSISEKRSTGSTSWDLFQAGFLHTPSRFAAGKKIFLQQVNIDSHHPSQRASRAWSCYACIIFCPTPGYDFPNLKADIKSNGIDKMAGSETIML